MVITAVVLAVFIGAATQRLTGMGFALVASPFIVVLLGPTSGVMLVNLCGMVSAVIVLSRTWREAEWKTAGVLTAFAVIGVVPGSWAAATLPAPLMQAVIGAMVILALASSLVLARWAPAIERTTFGLGTTGFTSGLMSASAGVAGPAVSAFAILSRWPQRNFAATLQPYLVVVAGLSLLTKWLFEPDAWPVLEWQVWVALALGLVGGQALGEWLSRRMPVETARFLMIGLAFLGATATLVTGLLNL